MPVYAFPLTLFFVDLAEIIYHLQWVANHGMRQIPSIKEEGTRVGLVVVSETQPNRHFWPSPLPWLILPTNAHAHILKPPPPPPPLQTLTAGI